MKDIFYIFFYACFKLLHNFKLRIKHLFKMLFDSKFKKICWVVFIVVIILCASLIRTVPNYSKKYGFEIVHLFDYKKYNQGYCLTENKILDKEELYKRAIMEYLEKELEVNKKVNDFRCREYSKFKSYCNILKTGYYRLNIDSFENFIYEYDNFKNEVEKIAKIEFKNIWSPYYETKLWNGKFIEKFKPKTINPMDFLSMDLENKVANFSIPVLFSTYSNHKEIYFKNTFLLCGDSIKQLDYYYFIDQSGVKQYDIYNIKCDGNWLQKIDNCGHIDYDVETIYLGRRELKGG